MLQAKLAAIEAEADREIARATSSDNLNEARVKYLGKKGILTQILRGLGNLDPDERREVGQQANRLRERMEGLLAEKQAIIREQEQKDRLGQESIDVTLPGRRWPRGRRHPLTLIAEEAKRIFQGMGFRVAQGPEIELEYYNFEALNMPPDHPARDMQDSFYITDSVLLRTHTSPVQVRVMEKLAPELPVKVIAPGRVYRRDDDATHSPMFHQVEGLFVDREVNFGHLKGVLSAFAAAMFGSERRLRFRPSYFPFTEPSAEVDISCSACGGSGCRVCGQSGWLEILGSGMVHPRVLEIAGYDPQQVSGFAFGMGLERIAMLKFGVNDLRLFFENDLRFLRQF